MNIEQKYFVFIYPSKGDVRSYLNLALYALSPREKWPAHVTVAGPFARRPRARAQSSFDGTVFSLGVWNFFSQGLNTVYIKVGMLNLSRYWNKPGFIGNPVPHMSIYNGGDREFAERIFNRIEPMKLYFSFPVSGIEIVNSSSQRRFDLRELIDPNCLEKTAGMNLDDISLLSEGERIEIAALALEKCRGRST